MLFVLVVVIYHSDKPSWLGTFDSNSYWLPRRHRWDAISRFPSLGNHQCIFLFGVHTAQRYPEMLMLACGLNCLTNMTGLRRMCSVNALAMRGLDQKVSTWRVGLSHWICWGQASKISSRQEVNLADIFSIHHWTLLVFESRRSRWIRCQASSVKAQCRRGRKWRGHFQAIPDMVETCLNMFFL